MTDRTDRRTLLSEVMEAFRLKPLEIVRVADRIACEKGVPSISRNYLGKLRRGASRATAEKIYLIVAAVREMTGVMLRPGELFLLEPEPAGPPPPRPSGGAVVAPVSSGGSRIAYLWRVLVTEDPAPSSDQAFEALYVEHGALMRGVAIHRFDIPPDDAEALVHDCFMAYLDRHTTIHDVRAWLFGAMRNSCMQYRRDRKREAPLLPEHDDTADAGAESSADSWMWKLTFAAVLARLNAKCRETLRSHYLSEEPKEALADRMSTTTGYVNRLISICRRRVHEVARSLGIFGK